MKNAILRVSTRGYYDLDNGKTLKKNRYYCYPKKAFNKLDGKKEITIMVHGLRNNKGDAVKKFQTAARRLKQLGYRYPVIGFSYDANTKGAHLQKTELKALRVGQKIAKKNGKNLSQFIEDFKKKNPETKIRIIGHSLGSEVIFSSIRFLSQNPKNKNILEGVYFFGSSIEELNLKNEIKNLRKTVKGKIVNYYNPEDEVLTESQKLGYLKNPLGLSKIKGNAILKLKQRSLISENHRFVSYAKKLMIFP